VRQLREKEKIYCLVEDFRTQDTPLMSSATSNRSTFILPFKTNRLLVAVIFLKQSTNILACCFWGYLHIQTKVTGLININMSSKAVHIYITTSQLMLDSLYWYWHHRCLNMTWRYSLARGFDLHDFFTHDVAYY